MCGASHSHLRTEGHSNGERKLLELSGTGAMSHPPADHGATALEHRNLETGIFY